MSTYRLRIVFDYLRAAIVRLRGAKLGPKSRIGKRFSIENARALHTGGRVMVEDNVSIKIVNPNAKVILGDGVFIGRNTIFDISNELIIGDRVLIAPNCFITDHNHAIAADLRIVEQGVVHSSVKIGDDAWIGANVVVLPGVKIGEGVVIGAGAVVTREVAAKSVAVGVPAKPIRTRN